MHRAARPMSRSSTSSLSVQVRRADLLKTRRAPELGGPYQHPDPRQGTRRWPMALHHGLSDSDASDEPYSRRRSSSSCRSVLGIIRGGAPHHHAALCSALFEEALLIIMLLCAAFSVLCEERRLLRVLLCEERRLLRVLLCAEQRLLRAAIFVNGFSVLPSL